jgi:hypothetical protein
LELRGWGGCFFLSSLASLVETITKKKSHPLLDGSSVIQLAQFAVLRYPSPLPSVGEGGDGADGEEGDGRGFGDGGDLIDVTLEYPYQVASGVRPTDACIGHREAGGGT